MTPPGTSYSMAFGLCELPRLNNPKFMGKPSLARSIPVDVVERPAVDGPAHPDPAANHGGDAVAQGVIDLIRADEVHMHIESTRGNDEPLANLYLITLESKLHLVVRRAKAPFLSGCESRPATVAPAGSSRSG